MRDVRPRIDELYAFDDQLAVKGGPSTLSKSGLSLVRSSASVNAAAGDGDGDRAVLLAAPLAVGEDLGMGVMPRPATGAGSGRGAGAGSAAGGDEGDWLAKAGGMGGLGATLLAGVAAGVVDVAADLAPLNSLGAAEELSGELGGEQLDRDDGPEVGLERIVA